MLLRLFSWTPQSLALLLVKLIGDHLRLDRGQVVVIVVGQGGCVVNLEKCNKIGMNTEYIGFQKIYQIGITKY